MSKRICPVVIGVMALSGCTSSLPYFEPIVSPLETSFDSSSKSTLQTGNIVFRQTVDFPETTILLDKFTSPPTGTYQFEHDVPAGTVLHPGQLSSPEYSGPGYCTLTPTMKMKPLVGEQLFGFTCFADTDNSGTFDVYFSKGRLRQKSDNGEIRHKGQSGPGSTPLSGGFPDSPVKLSEALSYKIEEGANTDERFEIIIKFMPSHGFGAHRLEMIKLDNGKETELLTGSQNIPSTENLPATLNFMGAKVEVLSVEGKILHYRIKSSLPPDMLISTELRN